MLFLLKRCLLVGSYDWDCISLHFCAYPFLFYISILYTVSSDNPNIPPPPHQRQAKINDERKAESDINDID